VGEQVYKENIQRENQENDGSVMVFSDLILKCHALSS
jgi:hypothetical protein